MTFRYLRPILQNAGAVDFFPYCCRGGLQLKDLTALPSVKLSIERDAYGVDDPVDAHMFDPEKDVDLLLPVTVNEQRLTNLLQAVMMGVCIAAMPLIKWVPVSVLWGYFFYIAFETVQGNQFCERLLLILTAPSRRYKSVHSNRSAIAIAIADLCVSLSTPSSSFISVFLFPFF